MVPFFWPTLYMHNSTIKRTLNHWTSSSSSSSWLIILSNVTVRASVDQCPGSLDDTFFCCTVLQNRIRNKSCTMQTTRWHAFLLLWTRVNGKAGDMWMVNCYFQFQHRIVLLCLCKEYNCDAIQNDSVTPDKILNV